MSLSTRREHRLRNPYSTRIHLFSLLGLTALCVPITSIAAEDEPLVEIVVTGSRLGSNTSSPSPIVVLDREELQHQGTPRVEDLLNSLPQVNSGLTLGANGPSVAPLTGTATADLRGIGAFRTLVLVNGRRPAPGDPINPSADLNAVPSALVKRVEVLTGGASAIYGSDAVSGVVNFILDTGFTGFKLDAEGAINRGSNDLSSVQSVERAAGITPATGSVYDGATQDVSVVFGRDFLDSQAHLTAYAGYRHTARVAGSSRDFAGCTLIETGASFGCLLDGTTALGQFMPNGGAGTPLTLDTANGHSFRALNSATDLYNPAPYQDLQRPDRRYNFGAFGSWRLSDAVQVYLEGMYTDEDTTVRYEPAGTTATNSALNVFGVNCNNPLLSPSQVNDLCTSTGLGPTDMAQVAIGRRNVEGLPRQDAFHHRSYRLVLGMKGEIAAPWSYDFSFSHGRVNERETLSNDISLAHLNNSLDVVSVNGAPTCASVLDGSDPSCIPYNIFSLNGVTPAAQRYISAGGQQSGFAQRDVANVQFTGDLGHYGIKSPLAADALSVALGAEYRVESVRYNPDAEYATGDLLTSGAAHPTEGTFRVGEVFAEAKVPLAQELPLLKDLILNLSDRYAHYTPQGNVNAYELFSSQVLGQIGVDDPCAGPTPIASAAQCALTGVTAAQYDHIAPQSSINVLTGGNRNLRPETADTFTAGFVFTPLSALLFSADYWRIKVKQYIGGIPGTFTLNSCLTSADPFYCSLIHRDASGSLSTGNGASAGRILGTRFNTGSYGTSGVDFEGRYRLGLDGLAANAGELSLSFTGSLALDNPINVTPGVSTIDCTDYFGPNCSGAGPTSPVPRWRHRLRISWESNFGLQLSANWRYIGHLKSEFTSGNPNLNNPANVFSIDSSIPAFNYLDLDASYALTHTFSLRAGMNNLLDRQPPIIGYAANPLLVNGNMAAGMYDMLGRYLFAGFTISY